MFFRKCSQYQINNFYTGNEAYPFYHRYYQAEIIDEIEKLKIAGIVKRNGFRYSMSCINEKTHCNKSQTMIFDNEEQAHKFLFLISFN